MINNDKWINSLPNTSFKNNNEEVQIDYNKWTNTIPKKNSFNSVKKYSLMATLFVCGFLLVSIVKNQTRYLEKEINYLKASIGSIEFNLKQAILDNEVITSPDNLSKLAKEHLNSDLKHYKKSQINNLNGNNKILKKTEDKNQAKIAKDLSENVKIKVTAAIKKKKEEIEQLQKLYNDPKAIPGEVKSKVAKQIQEKKFQLKNLYDNPKEMITLERVGKWGAVQVVKAFFGMPIIPGR